MFESIEAAPADPILGLSEAFQRDPNPEKINLSVGVYKDAHGATPILSVVKEAERRLLESETTKGYLGIAGSPEYAGLVRSLMLGPDHEALAAGRVATAQTPGGTGALRVAGEAIGRAFPSATLWMSEPTWPNHPKVFAAAGLPTKSYPYFDPAGNRLDADAMLAALDTIPAGDVVLLHGCCHNPTGVDPTLDQWRQIGESLARRAILPLVDFAYQGFGEGLVEDGQGLAAIVERCPEVVVCSSFSKNFGLYNERIGALHIIAAEAAAAGRMLSRIKATIRANYSNPPSHGAAIVATVLGDAALCARWEDELTAMRTRIHAMRRLFVETLAARGAPGDFSFIARQRGMFSFSGLRPEQVDRLREEHSIYIVGSGRINVAGMTADNMPRLCDAIVAVL